MDHLTATAAALAMIVTGSLAYDRAENLSLSRAEWACSRSHEEARTHYSVDPENRPVPYTIKVAVCDRWTRR